MGTTFQDWTLVFDLDGTLVETAPDLHAALNHTLTLKGLKPVSIETIRMMIGDGAKALIRKGLEWNRSSIDEAEIDEVLWPAFLDHYIANICRLSRPFEGALPTLEHLRAEGASLAVCTNKAQDLAERVLTGLSMADLFVATLGGDTAPSKKPDGAHIIDTVAKAGGNPAKTIMVGDSHTDERAARDAELPFVFVTFGYGALTGDPYDRIQSIDHWSEMASALKTLRHLS
ncbi:MAG: HAD hydrolase-like protein [Pseudomonadota bacterium]